jgi:hypothetical protein
MPDLPPHDTVTKQEHDMIVAHTGRPLTQAPIHRRPWNRSGAPAGYTIDEIADRRKRKPSGKPAKKREPADVVELDVDDLGGDAA